jgi:hypothetical protein
MTIAYLSTIYLLLAGCNRLILQVHASLQNDIMQMACGDNKRFTLQIFLRNKPQTKTEVLTKETLHEQNITQH